MPFPQPIDVRDYGAIGDGTTDDTLTIVTAIYQANLTTTAEMDDVYINYILELDMNT